MGGWKAHNKPALWLPASLAWAVDHTDAYEVISPLDRSQRTLIALNLRLSPFGALVRV